MSEQSLPFYYGAREAFKPGELVAPGDGFAYFTPNLDAAIWAAEVSDGDKEPRVYQVAATGSTEDVEEQPGYVKPPHPVMSWRSPEPLLVVGEVTRWNHYHGTKADLSPGDLLRPGYSANFGSAPRLANYVYFARTMDAAIWGAELAEGDGPGRVYLVEPTGPIEDDPNLTNMRFKGNPTKSFRSREPIRVTGEVKDWVGHPPEVVRAMKEGLARLEQEGIEPDDA